MAKKKVFVSFDYENDRRYYLLLTAWNDNPYIDFVFSDYTSHEIHSDSVAVVKACLTKKIKEATHTLCIVGAEANKPHADRWEIGYRNWQNFEVARSAELGKHVVAVKLDSRFESPEELQGIGASWAYSFSKESIVKALNGA